MIALLALGSAGAYELYDDDWSWQSEPIVQPVWLDAASFPAATGTTAAIEQAAWDGLDAWNGVGNLALALDTTQSGPEAGTIRLHWDADTADGAVIATAAGWGYGGTMISCEVFYWSANDWGAIDWATIEDPWQTDIAEVTTHEVGHCLGFDHSTDWGAVMRPAARGWRGIDTDDEDGLVAMYPPCTDADGDGFACDDCDDADPTVRPGAVEACNGQDDDCDGAVDETATTTASFGSSAQLSATRTAMSWLTLFDVDHDTALLSFRQSLDLPASEWVSFAVVDTTADTARVEVAIVPAGTGPVQSPFLGVPLVAGHRYAIGVGVAGEARYGYASGAGAPADGLVPLGARWESYAPPRTTSDAVHGAHQPELELVLADGDCSTAPDPTGGPTDGSTPTDGGTDPTGGSSGPSTGGDGCGGGCGSSAWWWALLPLGLVRSRRR